LAAFLEAAQFTRPHVELEVSESQDRHTLIPDSRFLTPDFPVRGPL
jgi:hypothetical protein